MCWSSAGAARRAGQYDDQLGYIGTLPARRNYTQIATSDLRD